MGNVLVPAPNPIRTEYASLRAAIQREEERHIAILEVFKVRRKELRARCPHPHNRLVFHGDPSATTIRTIPVRIAAPKYE